MMMRAIGRGGSSCSSRCQDCGNQAKRDCAYMRCRTCCKGKGFQCQTHIKSTWVPSSASSYATTQTQTLLHHHQILPSSAYVHQQSHKKRRLRENPPTGLDEEEEMGRNFAAMVRCIRVSSTEYAYQAQVSIEGHVFKGILYDQGLDLDYSITPTPVAEPHQPNLSNAHYHHHHHHHHQHSHNIILPSSPSPLPFNALMPHGMHFFQHSPSSPKSP